MIVSSLSSTVPGGAVRMANERRLDIQSLSPASLAGFSARLARRRSSVCSEVGASGSHCLSLAAS